jgi:excisionase family DNA binding protein
MCPISVNEAASCLGLSPITVRRLIKQGQLPHVRPVGWGIWEPEDVGEAILAGRSQEQDPTAQARRASVAHPSSFTIP